MAGTFTNQSGPSIDLEQIIADIERVTKSMNQLKKLTLWQWYLAPPGMFMRFEEPDEIIFAGSKETWQKTFHKLPQCDPSAWRFGTNETSVIDLAHNPDEEARARRLMMAKLEKLAAAEMEQMNNMGLKFSGLAYGNFAAFKNPKDSK